MKTLRNLALAGTVAIAAALSSGAANAAPVAALELGVPTTSASAVTPVFHFGPGYGSRLCYVPFFRLVQMFGYWRARMIKRRCFGGYGPYGGYNPWGGYYGY